MERESPTFLVKWWIRSIFSIYEEGDMAPSGTREVVKVEMTKGVAPSGTGEMASPEAEEQYCWRAGASDRKRPRLSSQYVISPFMFEAKRRMFIDGRYPNLFLDVDHEKWKAFEMEWWKILPRKILYVLVECVMLTHIYFVLTFSMFFRASRTIARRTILDAYK